MVEGGRKTPPKGRGRGVRRTASDSSVVQDVEWHASENGLAPMGASLHARGRSAGACLSWEGERPTYLQTDKDVSEALGFAVEDEYYNGKAKKRWIFPFSLLHSCPLLSRRAHRASPRRPIISPDRYHLLPLMQPGKPFSSPSHGNQREGAIARPTLLLLALVSLMLVASYSTWVLTSAVASSRFYVIPASAVVEAPQGVIEWEEVAVPAGQGGFDSSPWHWFSSLFTQAPAEDLARGGISHPLPATQVCEHAQSVAAGATPFSRQFGARDFQRGDDVDGAADPMRIALFSGAYSHIRDGVSLTLNKMVAYLESKGDTVLVFAPTNDDPAIEHVGKLLPVPSMPVPGRSDYRLSLLLSSKLRKELVAFNPDIVHIATPDLLGFQALMWAEQHGVRTACSYHTKFNSYLKFYHAGLIEPASWYLIESFYSRCDEVYVPSKEIMDELRDHGIDAELKIWARGVDTDLFSPDFRCRDWRASLGIHKDDVVLLTVSRVVWEKNIALFAKVLLALKEQGRKFVGVVVGDGPALHDLQQMLPDAIFLGSLTGEELSTAFASSDLFLFPSTTETFGSTTLEAMASGLPVVVANASGSNSLVSHGDNGFIAEGNDVPSFVGYASQLIANDTLRAQMGAAGRDRAFRMYQYDTIFGKLVDYYAALLHKD